MLRSWHCYDLGVFSPMIAAGVFGLLERLTDWLGEISSNPWFYVVIFVIAFLDSVVPVVPSETTVIIGGIAAGRGDLWIVLVIMLGAIGAFGGDSLAYLIGNRFRPLLLRILGRGGDDAEAKMAVADAQIAKRGGLLLITARFIPGGRTLTTLTCGATQRPYRQWFMLWDGIATVIWATYAGIIGFVFGEVFADNHTKAFWLAFGTALSITGLIEAVRWFRHRNSEEATL